MNLRQELYGRLRRAAEAGKEIELTPYDVEMILDYDKPDITEHWQVGDEALLTVKLGEQIIATVIRLTEDGVGILQHGRDLYRTDNTLCHVRRLQRVDKQPRKWWQIWRRK